MIHAVKHDVHEFLEISVVTFSVLISFFNLLIQRMHLSLTKYGFKSISG